MKRELVRVVRKEPENFGFETQMHCQCCAKSVGKIEIGSAKSLRFGRNVPYLRHQAVVTGPTDILKFENVGETTQAIRAVQVEFSPVSGFRTRSVVPRTNGLMSTKDVPPSKRFQGSRFQQATTVEFLFEGSNCIGTYERPKMRVDT